MMVLKLVLWFGLATAACGQAQTSNPAPNEDAVPVKSGLVAVEFSGSKSSLKRLAKVANGLGWPIEIHSDTALRILPPPNYNPDQFGLLLQRIEELGIRGFGLRLIGPNGPVGPEG